MDAPTLYISRDAEHDWLTALPYGRVSDGQPDEHYVYVGDAFRWCLDGPGGPVIGFEVVQLRDFDPDHPDYREIWGPPHFDAPLLALTAASAGEIVVAARARYYEESTLNRIYFSRAIAVLGEEALIQWRLCLEAGDPMAHYGLGYTLFELGRPLEAYAHLRHYAEIDPANSWAWCWFGRACAQLDRLGEARDAYERAVALEHAGSLETEAAELLAELEGRLADQPTPRRP